MTDEIRNGAESTAETSLVPPAAETAENVQDCVPADAVRRAWLDEHAELLAKWLPVLFWVMVINMVRSGLKSTFKLPEKIPAAGQVLDAASYACTLVQICVFWRLRKAERGFRTLAVIHTVTLAVTLAALAVLGTLDPVAAAHALSQSKHALALSGGLLAAVMGLAVAVTCIETTAYSSVSRYADEGLAGKWRGLRGWLVGMSSALLVTSVMLVLCAGDPFLFLNGWTTFLLLLMAAATIGMAVCNIVSLVYLYQTMTRFKSAAQELKDQQEEGT